MKEAWADLFQSLVIGNVPIPSALANTALELFALSQATGWDDAPRKFQELAAMTRENLATQITIRVLGNDRREEFRAAACRLVAKGIAFDV